jgi:hypothetical protein
MTVAAPRDPALPALNLLADRATLGALLAHARWLERPRVDDAAVRLRWKPGTNLRAGLVVPTDAGPAAVLVAEFAAGSGKADQLAERVRRSGEPLLRTGRLVVAPATADPALRRWLPVVPVPLSYNPDRRLVGRVLDSVIKVHAERVPAGVAELTARFVPGALTRRRVSVADWVHGRSPVAADLPAVTAAVRALHRTDPPRDLPVLTAGAVCAAARRAARAAALVCPELRDRLRAVVHLLEQAKPWPPADAVVHGDLSRDQVLVRPDGSVVLLDLDRAARGPAGWDGATWAAAELADPAPGSGPPPAPVPAPAVLRVAALLLRTPEPFRRLRPGWPQSTAALLTAAEHALKELR